MTGMTKQQQIAEIAADLSEYLKYMRELGLDALDADLSVVEPSVRAAVPPRVPEASGNGPQDRATPPVLPEMPLKRAAGARLAALPSLAKRERPSSPQRNEMHEKPGIPEIVSPIQSETPVTEDKPAVERTGETIEIIRAEIGNCTRCPLHTGRTQVVHSTGNFNADLMFVGEAPGADEDAQGIPFVGRAGQLLTKIIESIGLKREEVFIGNINRCRPPGNRQPVPEEAAVCRPYLLREIAVVKPKVIVVLGAHAAHNLLQVKTPISKLRGHFQDYFGVKVMPTFHPAYLLRDPHKKREVWEDMKLVREHLNSL
jgi:DNA polymerase